MKQRHLAAKIRARFAELLATNPAATTSLVKQVALEFGVGPSTVTDAITLGVPRKKGARK
jgi:hypothetical protein